jgi:perosamine synthetase
VRIPPLKVVFSPEDIQDILAKTEEVLSTGMLAQGKYVSEFEQKWASYVGVKHAVAVNSGSSAIEIPMRILGVEGKEVLVPDNTFAATAFAVTLAGGSVRFVDADPQTFAVRLEDIKSRRTANTVGVIVVHIGGIVTPEIVAIREWCEKEGLWLFEDGAHAHGSECDGKRAGTFGIAGAYSFFATKVMTTAEGGMIVTDDDHLAEQSRLMRNHGKPEPWVSRHTAKGANFRMSELNAILGLAQLKRLDEFIEWREKIATLYTAGLASLPQLTPIIPAFRSSWYKYIVLLPAGLDRANFKQRMKQQGVSLSGEVYEIPLHRQPIFEGLSQDRFPRAEDICSRHVCLPLYYGLTEEEAGFVISSLRATLANDQ